MATKVISEADALEAKIDMLEALTRVADKVVELLDLACDHIKQETAERSDARRKPS